METYQRKAAIIDGNEGEIRVLFATETPVMVRSGMEMIPHILLRDGIKVPDGGSVPFLDNHRSDGEVVRSVLGSVRNIVTTQDGNEGSIHFAETEEGKRAAALYRDKHIRAVSVGVRVDPNRNLLERGEKKEIMGRIFEGPALVSDEWYLDEVSAVVRPADPNAKTRKEIDMSDELKKEERKEPVTTAETKEKVEIRVEKVVDQEAIERAEKEAADKELVRGREIRNMCRRFGFEDMQDELIDGKVSIDDARKAVEKRFDTEYKKEDGKKGFGFARASISDDASEKFRRGAFAGLMTRLGKVDRKDIDHQNEFRSMSLMELGKAALRVNNQPLTGNDKQIATRALSTSDFTLLLSDSVNKMVFDGYNEQVESFERWTGESPARDFKRNEMPRLGATGTLEEITTEGAEGKFGLRAEEVTYYTLREFFKIWKFTRRALIDDDTGKLWMAEDYGRAAKRTAGDVAYEALTNNIIVTDAGNVALFSSGHGNLEAVLTQVPEVDSLDAGDLAMGKQTDPDGSTNLNVVPEYIIIPRALKGHCMRFFGSDKWHTEDSIGTVDAAVSATRHNPWAGALEIVVETRLDSNSATAWYLAGTRGKTVNMVYRNGIKTPEINTWMDPDTRAMNISVGLDVAAHPVDYRWLFKNPGA